MLVEDCCLEVFVSSWLPPVGPPQDPRMKTRDLTGPDSLDVLDTKDYEDLTDSLLEMLPHLFHFVLFAPNCESENSGGVWWPMRGPRCAGRPIR